jgi:hypothetical protein
MERRVLIRLLRQEEDQRGTRVLSRLTGCSQRRCLAKSAGLPNTQNPENGGLECRKQPRKRNDSHPRLPSSWMRMIGLSGERRAISENPAMAKVDA